MTTVGDFVREAKPGFACGTIDPQGVFQFRMNNVNKDGALDLAKRRRVPRDAHRSLASFEVAPNDVLFNSTNSPDGVGRAGLVRGLDEPAVYSNHFLRLRTDSLRLDPSYFWRWLNLHFQRGVFLGMCRQWVNQATVSSEALLNMKLDPPPLDEQRRIAAILDQADGLRLKRRVQLALHERLAAAAWGSAVQEGDHQSVPLGDICLVKGGKRTPKGTSYSTTPTAHPYLRVTDMRDGTFRDEALEYLTSEVARQISRYTVNAGDVVISIAGSIGLIAEVPASLDGANLTENAAKLVAKYPVKYVPGFLAAALNSPEAQAQISSRTGRVTIGKLALFRIEMVEVPLPPLAVQQQIADKLSEVSTSRAQISGALARMDALFASLQARAFAGEL